MTNQQKPTDSINYESKFSNEISLTRQKESDSIKTGKNEIKTVKIMIKGKNENVKYIKKLIIDYILSLPDEIFLDEIGYRTFFSDKKTLKKIKDGKIPVHEILSYIETYSLFEKINKRIKAENKKVK